MTWMLMPVLSSPAMTEAAIADCLAQSVPTRVLVINQGVETAFRERLERIAEEYPDRVFLWSHDPPLPSLSASWNRALDFVWETGGTEALVINNDVRLRPDTIEWLSKIRQLTHALFVSAVGVTAEQFNPEEGLIFPIDPDADEPKLDKGGPDFSCYLMSKECHDRFRFDEAFIPAYCEDLDYHRRLMLAGEGSRIFSVNLPFLHFAAQTLKTVDPNKRLLIEAKIASGSRAHYAKKWGGPVNGETFYTPFGDAAMTEEWAMKSGPRTPQLQQWVQLQALAPKALQFERLEELLSEEAPPAAGPHPSGAVGADVDNDIPF